MVVHRQVQLEKTFDTHLVDRGSQSVRGSDGNSTGLCTGLSTVYMPGTPACPQVVHNFVHRTVCELYSNGSPLAHASEKGEAARCANTLDRFYPLACIDQGGTSVKSNNGLADAARKHLEIVRRDHERQVKQDALYVLAAYTYGIEPDEIAVATGLPLETVRQILRGA